MLTNSEREILFPALANHCYLNTAWRGPISKPARDAVMQYTDGMMEHGVNNWDEWTATFNETRALFADFVGADADEVIFLGHATDAFSRIALGVDLHEGDEVRIDFSGHPRSRPQLLSNDCEFG